MRQSVLALCLLSAACNEHTASQSHESSSSRTLTTTPTSAALLPSTSNESASGVDTHRLSETSAESETVQSKQPRVLHPNIRQASVKEQQQYIVDLLRTEMSLSEEQVANVSKIVTTSDWLSFGNPKISRPSMSQTECLERRENAAIHPADAACGAPNMVIAKQPSSEKPAALCVDQYEFPNVECEYPVIWVRSSEAAKLCEAVGKRLCDAHEWEGACAGEVLSEESEYPWAQMPASIARSGKREQRLWLEYEHNRTRSVRWAYGPKVSHQTCGTGARKDSKCNVVDFSTCSSSTYPAGAFPQCVSPLGVYDQHGNAAEHMNLPLQPSELTSHGGLGWTEMKGSWFIFTNEQSHPDDCRWRAKSWHTTKIGDWNSHRNYHLGFRCCKDVATSGFKPAQGKREQPEQVSPSPP